MDSMTILVAANDGIDNMSSLQVLAGELQERGHRVVFAVDIAAKGVITTYCDIADFDRLTQADLDCSQLDMSLFELSEIDLFEKFDLDVLRKKLKRITKRDYYFEKLLERIKPDVIIVESSICSPALTNCGIPWLWLNFGNPNRFINDDRLPPIGSGMNCLRLILEQKWIETNLFRRSDAHIRQRQVERLQEQKDLLAVGAERRAQPILCVERRTDADQERTAPIFTLS